MNDCKPYTTSVDMHANVSFDIGASFNDPTTHHNLDEAFQYLTFTRLAISYAVQQVCLHIHDPHGPHFTSAKHILRYLEGTLDHDMPLHHTSTSELVIYTDIEWAGCPDTRQSTSDYAVFLCDNLLYARAYHLN
jgi:hypothetical protein